MMSSDVQSSCTKDTFETRSISKVTDDSSLSDESSMPSLGMEIETNAHFEQLQCAFEIPVVIEMACVDLDFTHYSITNCFQDRRWKKKDMKEWYKLNELVDDLDAFGEVAYDFDDFPDSDDDDEGCYCDDFQDSIRLTRSRFRKKNVAGSDHSCRVMQDGCIE
jgi:hypothetical protein